MDNLVVIKTDIPIDRSILSALVKSCKSMVVLLPMACTISTKEDAIKELRNYKEVLDRFL